jgi:hypothetical protein
MGPFFRVGLGEPVGLVRGDRPGGVEVSLGLAEDFAQAAPEIVTGGAPPEPAAAVDRVDQEVRRERERVRHHRVMVGVAVLADLEVPLHHPTRIGQERPRGTGGLLHVPAPGRLVGRDRHHLRVGDLDSRHQLDDLAVLLVVFGTEVPAGEDQDHRIAVLHLAEALGDAVLVWQLVVGE